MADVADSPIAKPAAPPAAAPASAAQVPQPVSAPQTFDLTVEEFCTRKSGTDTRVELLAGFYSDEVRAGRVKDSEPNFQARYGAFADRPVS